MLVVRLLRIDFFMVAIFYVVLLFVQIQLFLMGLPVLGIVHLRVALL